jgi:hypothetical protein
MKPAERIDDSDVNPSPGGEAASAQRKGMADRARRESLWNCCHERFAHSDAAVPAWIVVLQLTKDAVAVLFVELWRLKAGSPGINVLGAERRNPRLKSHQQSTSQALVSAISFKPQVGYVEPLMIFQAANSADKPLANHRGKTITLLE